MSNSHDMNGLDAYNSHIRSIWSVDAHEIAYTVPF